MALKAEVISVPFSVTFSGFQVLATRAALDRRLNEGPSGYFLQEEKISMIATSALENFKMFFIFYIFIYFTNIMPSIFSRIIYLIINVKSCRINMSGKGPLVLIPDFNCFYSRIR